MYVNLGQYLVFLLVMLRMTGMTVTNPILGRRNIPPMLGVGLAFVLAVLLTSVIPFPTLPAPTLFEFLFMAARELAVGIMASFILQLFLSIITIGGEIIDMQIGMSMAKMFDPAYNASVSITATLLNAMFILTFFYTNNHLTLIALTAKTFDVIPVGATTFNPDVLYYIPDLFSTILVFAMKLCMPVVVIEVVVTMAVGIIMRIIPQINIFVVNIQFKMLIGFFVLIVLVVPFTGLFENLIVICFEHIQNVWLNFV